VDKEKIQKDRDRWLGEKDKASDWTDKAGEREGRP
jgi:hypothetical protein